MNISFKKFTLEDVPIDPGAENIRAIRCYEKAGFLFSRFSGDINGRAMIMEFTKYDELKKAHTLPK